MLNRTKRSIANYSKGLLATAVLMSLGTFAVSAAEPPQHRTDSSDNKKVETSDARVTETVTTPAVMPAANIVLPAMPNDTASYVLYADLTAPGGPDPARMTRPRTVSYSLPSLPSLPPYSRPSSSSGLLQYFSLPEFVKRTLVVN